MDPDDILRDLLTEENHGLRVENERLRARVAELEVMQQRAREVRWQMPLSDQMRAERRSARYILLGEVR